MGSDEGYFDLVKLALEKGADIHTEGDRALKNAVFFGYEEMAEISDRERCQCKCRWWLYVITTCTKRIL